MSFTRQFATVLAVAVLSIAQADTIYVDDDAPLSGDGFTWATAYRYLQDALEVAADPLNSIWEIRVAQGIYRPDEPVPAPSNCCVLHLGVGCTDAECQAAVCAVVPQCCEVGWSSLCVAAAELFCDGVCGPDRDATFQLVNGVSFLGGFAGIGAAEPDARNIELYETILSGDLLANDDLDDFPFSPTFDENSLHVVTSSGAGANTIIDGFTITAGYAVDQGFEEAGGMYNIGSSPSVSNCKFSFNTGDGGGMVNLDDSDPKISNCVFVRNFGFASAMANRAGSDPTITGCLFDTNSLTAMVNEEGSSPNLTDCVFTDNGFYAMKNSDDSNPIITDCIFSGNGSTAILTSGGNPIIVDCAFIDNGAGVAASTGNPIVIGCTFRDNTGSAMINGFDSRATVIDCVFIDNLADTGFSGRGGGMRNADSDPLVINCLFSRNIAAGPLGGQGGGMYSKDSNAVLINCVFVGNRIEGILVALGGAIYNEGGSLDLINCTLTGNEVGLGMVAGGVYNNGGDVSLTSCIVWGNDNDELDGTPMDVTFSLVEGGHAGLGNIDADPLMVDPDNGDFRLSAGSPCIDAGDNTAVPQGVLRDLDGNPRFVADACAGASGATVDMGAYEFQGKSCDLSDVMSMLASWGLCRDCGKCVYDFDGDCSVGILDLLILLGNLR